MLTYASLSPQVQLYSLSITEELGLGASAEH